MKLSLTDADGQAIPCNGEDAWTAPQKALATWAMIELLGPATDSSNLPQLRAALRTIYGSLESGFDASRVSHSFFALYCELGGKVDATLDLAEVTEAAVAVYRSRFGELTRLPVTNHFPSVEDQLSLYKFCRWACVLASNGDSERRLLLHYVRVNLNLQGGSRALLIASGVEQSMGLKSLTRPERSLLPVVALATKLLLTNDGRFDADERHALRTLMLMLGVKAGDLPDLAQHVKREARELAAEIAPEDGAVALAALLRLSILDHKITTSERDLLSTVVEVTNLDNAALNDVQARVELDTGARIRLSRALTIDYGRM
jgi:hypothetical protein